MARALVWVVTLAIGAVAAGVSWVLGGSKPAMVAATGVSYAVVARLTARYPDTLYESGVAPYRVGRWSGLAGLFVVGVTGLAVVGLHLPPDYRLSVGLLVIGVGYASWLFGVAYARAKEPTESSDKSPTGSTDDRTTDSTDDGTE